MSSALTHYLQLPPSPVQAQVDGERALQRLHNIQVPSRKSEYWRYTSLDPMFDQLFWPAPGLPAKIDRERVRAQCLSGNHPRLVFVNGWYDPLLSETHEVKGLSFTTLAAQQGENAGSRFSPVTAETSLFDALNRIQTQDGLLLEVHSDYPSRKPLELVHITISTSQSRLVQPRHRIHLHANASIDLIEHQVDLGSMSSFGNRVYEISLDTGARLHQQRLLSAGDKSYTLIDTRIQQASDSEYLYTGMQAGGAWIREQFQVGFTQPGARCTLNGLSLVGDAQLRDYHIDIQHRVAQCTSRSLFKNILMGKGRGVFDGRILVEEQAQKTDAYLSNASLLLTDGAEIDSKPQLEILADDVQCGHGSSIGQLDQDMLFYMQSRGIPRQSASNMLCHGFAMEVLQAFAHTGFRQRAAMLLTERLLPVI